MSETGLVKLSRLMALQRELDVVANNVANLGTTGFKAQRVAFKEYLKPIERAEAGIKPERPVSLVDGRGGFTDLSKGAMEPTGNGLDVAIEGDAYFVVQTTEGERYTRDGSFTLDRSGQVVTAAGQLVLGTSGPLTLSSTESDATIGQDGTVSTNRGVRGRLRLARFQRPEMLVPVGGNLFRSDQRPTEPPAGTVRLLPGTLEKSNLHAVVEMSRLVEITRAYELVAAMMKEGGDKNELQRLAEA